MWNAFNNSVTSQTSMMLMFRIGKIPHDEFWAAKIEITQTDKHHLTISSANQSQLHYMMCVYPGYSRRFCRWIHVWPTRRTIWTGRIELRQHLKWNERKVLIMVIRFENEAGNWFLCPNFFKFQCTGSHRKLSLVLIMPRIGIIQVHSYPAWISCAAAKSSRILRIQNPL